jgi:hypothetical protein
MAGGEIELTVPKSDMTGKSSMQSILNRGIVAEIIVELAA